MDITKVYLEGTEIKAVELNDEGLQYPILVESLHKPEVLDNLLKSGWELYGLPYDLRKGDVELRDLPAEQKSFSQFSQDDQQEMMDMKIGLYKEVDLMAKISKSVPVVYVEFNKSLGLIKTREEMLRFLGEWNEGKITSTDPRYYMPLNSFVAPQALFSFDEYVSNENAYYRNVIESRRNLAMDTFDNLTSAFIAQGLSKDFNAKTLVDQYLRWGLCGMNIKVREVRQEEHNFTVGSIVRPDVTPDKLPYVKRSEITYLDQDGIVYYPGETRNLYKTDESTNVLQSMATSLARMSLNDENVKGMKVVTPTKISSNITTRVTVWEGDTRVVYDEHTILVENNRTRFIMRPLNVISNVNSGTSISTDMYNYRYTEEGRQKLADFLYAQAIVNHLVEVKTVKADVSTVKALSVVSVSEGAASRYLTQQPIVHEMYKDELASKRNLADLSDDLREYIYGHVDELQPDTETLFNLFSSNQINIDSIGMGIDSDAQASTEQIADAIYVARKYLGLSYNDIYEQVRNLTGDEEKVYLKGNGLALVVYLSSRDKALRGYYADVKEYGTLQCEQAMQFHFVTRIFRALSPVEPATGSRHSAVETLTYVKHRTGPERKLYQALDEYFKHYISYNVLAKDQDRAERQIPRMIAKAIFSIYIEGKIHHLPLVGGKVEEAPAYLVQLARQSVIKRFDSLIAITEQSISNGGKFFSYIANATITPDLVIPYKGYEIPEQSLYYYWWAPQDGDSLRHTLVEKGHIPHFNWPGMGLTYEWYDLPGDGKKSSDKEGRWAIYHYGNSKLQVLNNPISMTAYVNFCEEWMNQYKNDPRLMLRDPMPYKWEVFKNLYTEEIEQYINEAQYSDNAEPFKFRVNPTRIVTRELILEEHEDARNLMDPTLAYTASKEAVKRFKGLTAEELYILASPEKIIEATNFNGKVPVYWNATKGVIIVSDETGAVKEYRPEEIDTIDTNKYAVRNVYGRKYVFKDYKGDLYSVIK